MNDRNVWGVFMKKIVKQDMERIFSALMADEKAKFSGSTVLLTGGAGFLGFYFIRFFTYYCNELNIKR